MLFIFYNGRGVFKDQVMLANTHMNKALRRKMFTNNRYHGVITFIIKIQKLFQIRFTL